MNFVEADINLCAFLTSRIGDNGVSGRIFEDLEFFTRVRDAGIYQLSTEGFFDKERLLASLTNGTSISYLRFVSFGQLEAQQSQLSAGQLPHGSIKEMLLQTGFLSRRAFEFYPEDDSVGEEAVRKNLKYHLHQAFGRSPVATPDRREAFYWPDAIKILAGYLRLAIGLSCALNQNSKEVLRQDSFLRSERVVRLLRACVPLGWKNGNFSGSEIVVLCA
jgi:hypothetical protein